MSTKSPSSWRSWARVAPLACACLQACARDAAPPDRRVIELEPGPVIRESGDSVLFNDQSTLIATADGFMIGRVEGGRSLAFYDSSGRLTQLEGLKGKGPGEYSEVASIGVGPGDSIYVGDGPNGRISVLSPHEHRFVRSFPAARHETSFQATAEGRIMGASLTVSRAKGIPERFAPRRVAWNDTTITPIGDPKYFDRISRVAPASSGRVWATDGRTYRLVLLDGQRVVRAFDQVRDWYPPDTSSYKTLGGRPFVAEINADGDSLLWVFLRRPNPAWSPARPPTRPVPIGVLQLPPLGDVYVGTLEALDANTGQLIASIDVPGDMRSFIGPGRLYQLTDDSTGALHFRVMRARLKTAK